MPSRHLDLLKAQIDTNKVDFSIFVKVISRPPTDDDYRAAVRYAYTLVNERFSNLASMYDRSDRLRQQALLDAAHAAGRRVLLDELDDVKVERFSEESLKVKVDEEWIREAKKWYLQSEIKAAVEVLGKLEVERERLVGMCDELPGTEKANLADEKTTGQEVMSGE